MLWRALPDSAWGKIVGVFLCLFLEDPARIKISGRKTKMSLYFQISCVFKRNGEKEIMRAPFMLMTSDG